MGQRGKLPMAIYKVRAAYVSRDKELKWDTFKTGDRKKALGTYNRLRHGAERIQVLKDDRLIFECKAELIEPAAGMQALREFFK